LSKNTLDEPRRRWIGRLLRNKWRIDARIARGGVGTVYAATHENDGSRAAIKVLHPELSRDTDTRSRFLQEGYAANQVNHPGVVRILEDDTTEDGHPYIVMELLEGELLEARRIRKGGKLPIADVYEVAEQLLDMLAAAHEKRIVHRDIKPDNLFITHEGRLKVLDFGLAQVKSSFRNEQTATGFLLGTPGFMSPEQAVGDRRQIDAQTDIWSVGATRFTLLSGVPVHPGESAAEMLMAAAKLPPRSLETVTNGLNPRLVKVVDRAVAFAKADRWPNARTMQLALREVSGKHAAGQVSRRSIPDDPPMLFDDPLTEIEELDTSELEDRKASWGSTAERAHPAYDDGPTIAGPPPAMDDDPEGATLPSQPDEEWNSGGTLIMRDPGRKAPPMAPEQPWHPHHPYPSPPAHQHVETRVEPLPRPRTGASDDERMLDAARAMRTPREEPPPPQSRVLLFVGVCLCTMIVVIVAGLVILGTSD
jgi:serine/threonine-protein kinase